MENYITYLFGAGASAKAIPIVRETKKHLLTFKEHLKGYLHKNPGGEEMSDGAHIWSQNQ